MYLYIVCKNSWKCNVEIVFYYKCAVSLRAKTTNYTVVCSKLRKIGSPSLTRYLNCRHSSLHACFVAITVTIIIFAFPSLRKFVKLQKLWRDLKGEQCSWNPRSIHCNIWVSRRRICIVAVSRSWSRLSGAAGAWIHASDARKYTASCVGRTRSISAWQRWSTRQSRSPRPHTHAPRPPSHVAAHPEGAD